MSRENYADEEMEALQLNVFCLGVSETIHRERTFGKQPDWFPSTYSHEMKRAYYFVDGIIQILESGLMHWPSQDYRFSDLLTHSKAISIFSEVLGTKSDENREATLRRLRDVKQDLSKLAEYPIKKVSQEAERTESLFSSAAELAREEKCLSHYANTGVWR